MLLFSVRENGVFQKICGSGIQTTLGTPNIIGTLFWVYPVNFKHTGQIIKEFLDFSLFILDGMLLKGLTLAPRLECSDTIGFAMLPRLALTSWDQAIGLTRTPKLPGDSRAKKRHEFSARWFQLVLRWCTETHTNLGSHFNCHLEHLRDRAAHSTKGRG
ncbi:hypothetical protein AAY473_039738 [Plecturocebus cupreus]